MLGVSQHIDSLNSSDGRVPRLLLWEVLGSSPSFGKTEAQVFYLAHIFTASALLAFCCCCFSLLTAFYARSFSTYSQPKSPYGRTPTIFSLIYALGLCDLRLQKKTDKMLANVPISKMYPNAI